MREWRAPHVAYAPDIRTAIENGKLRQFWGDISAMQM